MWQRIQTVFLSVAALAAVGFLFAPIAVENNIEVYGKSNVIASGIAIAIALLSLFIISQFQDRKLQLRFTLINIFIAIALAVVAALGAMQNNSTPRYEFAIGIPVLIIVALLLAYRNIKKDEDLVKSMDRFR